jgi:hypothetical protein
MDEERTTTRTRRLKAAGIAAAALLAVPGGMAISNAMAADGGTGAQAPAAVQVQEGAPQAPERGDRDRGVCPGHDGERGGSAEGAPSTGEAQQ